MGKTKKARVANYNHDDGPNKSKARKPQQQFSNPKHQQNHKKKNQQKQQQQNRPLIPFQESDRILLVGEGDFSFALSLATHHKCRNLLATCYDAGNTLYEKYPQAKRYTEQLMSGSPTMVAPSASDSASRADVGTVSEVVSGTLKRKRDGVGEDGEEEEEEGKRIRRDGEGDDEAHSDAEERSERNTFKSAPRPTQQHAAPTPKVLFSIDARKLGSTSGGGKIIRNGLPRQHVPRSSSSKPWETRDAAAAPTPRESRRGGGGGPWDVICFNFPHVGGLSTDVNRQVRANQELLVDFFKASVPLLSLPLPPQKDEGSFTDEEDWENDYEGFSDGEDDSSTAGDGAPRRKEKVKPRTEPGQILVTLFEGEPYTLWNIRDLARHAGLRVVMSFKFPWTSYPGYSHARTLGEIEAKNGSGSRGGWKGEDREARTYVFERIANENGAEKKQKKKRKGGGDSDDSD
ncbi:hypothetical protein AJ80_09589 [Polytolypa hystricis UAMH7299]|uniref:25S rRNA (uridine-N(3))-methyltransferase BMT5-like domain-containing protein n=1 Tax=Polytolypa hystricis (strain UAMH7299) TaxID=1447883 RepID=A0A2B7WNJ6_POLH7|nr:hypothetical protein AJ80_09589 [Polytolypa hystricis UAMH7299]